MRITHPQAPFQGVAPENVFFVANDQQIQLGTGYVMLFYQGEMYPERPAHLFLQIDAQPSARALMFGALLARAEQLRAQTPNLPSRLYAQVMPDDQDIYMSEPELKYIHLYEFPDKLSDSKDAEARATILVDSGIAAKLTFSG